MIRYIPIRIIKSSVNDIKQQINRLKLQVVIRREEEISKFILKKAIKFIQKNLPSEGKERLEVFYKEYFDGILSKSDFETIFSISKGFFNKRRGN